MKRQISISKEEIENMKLLTDEEIKKLSFHELCIYLNNLEIAEAVLERGNS